MFTSQFRTRAVSALRVLAAGGLTFLAACNDAKNATSLAAATDPSFALDTRTTVDCTKATQNPAKVVCLANAFKATLTTTQLATLQQAYTASNATRWSNLPTNLVSRLGVKFSSLNAAQQAAALNLAKAALSTAGYTTFQSIRAADTYLHQNQGAGGGTPPIGGTPPGGGTPPDSTRPPGGGPGGGTLAFGDSLYYVAFLGAPSTTGPWILKIDGHHLAINLHYNGTQTPTATPNFVGIEPQVFTLNGVTYTPLQSRKVAMYTMINSLNAVQLAGATLGTSFSDVLLGPGQDGKFPAHQGLRVSSLSAAQQQLVKNAIEEWVKLQPTVEANNLLATYEDPSALAQTYIASSGGRDSTKQGSYIRIDGPRVWIEFVCQNGIVFQSQIHFHTIWRDRQQDYGGDFTF
ncbi:hypothetical protein tb265_41290 [Gemmatimonadetes bacterium T265]|nr:hypothetical protein tb265_41290 [Gemmatimonadetes bacterium T265]